MSFSLPAKCSQAGIGAIAFSPANSASLGWGTFGLRGRAAMDAPGSLLF